MSTQLSTKQQIGTAPLECCALCGNDGEFIYLELQDCLFGANGSWNLAKCSNRQCGLIWIDPMPCAEDIEKAYINYYTHEPQEEKGQLGILKRINRCMKRGYLAGKYDYPLSQHSALLKTFGKFLYLFPLRRSKVDEEVRYLQALPQGRLLDVGCGSGAWLLFMRGLGWQVEGLDFDENAANVARQRGLRIHCGPLETHNFPDECFDAITLHHVIEHIPNPVATLVECRRILKRNGKLVLSTPNTASLGHRVFKHYWRGLEPPRHLYLFCPSAMKSMLALAGFYEYVIHTTNSDYVWKHSVILRIGGGEFNQALKFATKIIVLTLTLMEQMFLVGNPEAGESLAVRVFKK